MYEMMPLSLATLIAFNNSSLVPQLVLTPPFWSNSPDRQEWFSQKAVSNAQRESPLTEVVEVVDVVTCAIDAGTLPRANTTANEALLSAIRRSCRRANKDPSED